MYILDHHYWLDYLVANIVLDMLHQCDQGIAAQHLALYCLLYLLYRPTCVDEFKGEISLEC